MATKGKKNGAKFVLIRTTGAGVHCGVLVAANQREGWVRLTDARRVWNWHGGNSLHELSLRGAAETGTRISEPIAEIDILGVHEILTCTPEAAANLRRSRWT